MTDLTRAVCSALNLFMFQNVWNEPVSEYRLNCRPRMFDGRSKTGHFTFSDQDIGLPTNTDPYYIFSVSRGVFHGILNIPNDGQWLSLTELCNKYDVLIHAFNSKGLMFNRGAIYVRWNRDATVLFVAVLKQMAMRLVKHADIKDIYLSMYYDSDVVNNITTSSFKVPAIDPNLIYRRQIWDAYNISPDQTTLYVDGYEVAISGAQEIPVGSYVDVITDENIVATFDIDLTQTNPNQNYLFFSETDKVNKQIIHIPKALNPMNKVLTHNTLDIIVRKKNDSAFRAKGLYLHRCQSRSVTQITHNDIAIPDYILNAYRDALGTQDITLHVICRQHEKDNVLVRDKAYIDLLYTHTDEQICDHLLGRISSKLPFWKASSLEKSGYIQMFFDVPDLIVESNMTKYIEALGYYHVLALICDRVFTTTITDLFRGSYNIAKPLVYKNQPVHPVVYLNGSKLRFSSVTITDTASDRFKLTLADTVGWQIGDELAAELFITGPNKTFRFTPTEEKGYITIPYQDVLIYEELSNTPVKAEGVDMSSSLSYEAITDFVGKLILSKNQDGTCTVRFGTPMYGRTCIIQNRYTTYQVEKNVDDMVLSGAPIRHDLFVEVEDDYAHDAPVLHVPGMSVFLNGRYLIEGLDYTILTIKDGLGRTSFKQVVVQNMTYLKETDNILELLVTAAENEDRSHGFVVDDTITGERPTNLWFANLSMVHVEGRLQTKIIDHGGYLSLPEGAQRQGAPYEVRTSVPTVVKEFMDTYHSNDDKERLAILNEYFYGKRDVTPDTVILPYSVRIYSTHLAVLIRDLINGTIKVALDPDTKRMLTQVSSYDRYKQFDLVQSGSLDLDYVDVFPTYRHYEVVDTEMYKVIHALSKLILPEDTINSGEVANV